MARVLLSCLAFSAVSWGYSTGYSYGSSAVSSGTRFEQDVAKYQVAIARFCNTKTCECGKYSKKWLELRKKINCAKNVLMEDEAAKIKTISGYEYAMIKFCTP